VRAVAAGRTGRACASPKHCQCAYGLSNASDHIASSDTCVAALEPSLFSVTV
jgi:hypothetical protein